MHFQFFSGTFENIFSVYQWYCFQRTLNHQNVKGEVQAVEGEERYFLRTKGCSTNLVMMIFMMFMVIMTMIWICTKLVIRINMMFMTVKVRVMIRVKIIIMTITAILTPIEDVDDDEGEKGDPSKESKG